MKNTLRILLDRIFELEGLVTLALKRDDSPEEFLRLISQKGSEIAEESKKLKEFGINKMSNEPDTSLIQDKIVDSLYIGSGNPSDSQSSTNMDDEFSLSEYSIDDDSEESLNNDEIDNPNNSEESSPRERGKLIFSINEKFRYRKELFDNSDIDFNNTLALVASMETFEEAEDYFLNEERFDPANPIVIEFMDVIKRYFK